MGRYDFRPLRVRQTAQALVETKRTPTLPAWYKIVGDIPPGETLARPVQRAPRVRGKARKPSRLFQPLPITYPEDKLRSEFFGDHPWELARPRLVVEDSGSDARTHEWWKGIVQTGKQLDGESVVQRQMWLMKHKHLSKPQAYDVARREFYKHRHLEEVRRRVAKEEALHVGAYFAKGPLEVGMELEDKSFENWKSWAASQIEEEQQMRAQLFSGPQTGDDATSNDYEPALDEVQDSAPNSSDGQTTQGAANVRS